MSFETTLGSSQSHNSNHKSFRKHLMTEQYGSPTVHDRGRGYSNSFTLCRGGTLSPQHSINPSGQPWVTIHKYADNQSSPIWLLTLVQALLLWAWPPSHGNPPSWELHRDSYFTSFFTRKPQLNPFCHRTHMVVKEPILRHVNYKLSPTHIRYCGCTVKIGKYRIRTQPSVFIKVIS